MSEAVEQARTDLDDGRLWKARDVLTERVAEHHDLPALDLLGQVLHDMGDLPAAGAAWFGTRRLGDDVDAAVAAWRERYGDDFVAMWHSLPRSVRIHPGSRRLEALRERARRLSADVPPPAGAVASPSGPAPGPAPSPASSSARPRFVTAGLVDIGTTTGHAVQPSTQRENGDEVLSRPPFDGSPQATDGTVGEPERGGGLDAATIIAWVVAALFVLCAVVGLVTVLRWMVPGG